MRMLLRNADGTILDMVSNIRRVVRLLLANKVTIISDTELMMKYYIRIPHTSVPPVSKRNILLRDDYKCQYCGKPLTTSTATIDHVDPRLKQPERSRWSNVVACCPKCNRLKADSLPPKGFKRPKTPSRWTLIRKMAERDIRPLADHEKQILARVINS